MALTNYLEDDWDDNSLTSRTSPSKDVFYQYGDGGAGDLLKGVYRPRWTTESGSPSATNNELQLSDGSTTYQAVSTPSNLSVGEWGIDFQANAVITGGSTVFEPIQAGSLPYDDSRGRPTDGYFMQAVTNGSFELLREDTGSNSATIISGTWDDDTSSHTGKFTRDSYGGFELFYDASSQGTTTDTNFSTFEVLAIENNQEKRIDFDNLVVK